MMSRLLTTGFLLSLCCYCQATFCGGTFLVEPVCSVTTEGLLNTYDNIRSRLECSVVCIQDSACKSSYFNDPGICQTFSEYKIVEACQSQNYYIAIYETSCPFLTTTPVPTTTTTTTTVAPTTTLAPVPVIPSPIFTACVGNNECPVSNSECRSSKCQCIIGYSYDEYTYTCVTDCLDYGYSFQEDLDHLLVGFSDKTVATTDPGTCMVACVEETTFVCRTVEIWKPSSPPKCYLSVETAYTQPSSRSANADYDVYQRDCAPPGR